MLGVSLQGWIVTDWDTADDTLSIFLWLGRRRYEQVIGIDFWRPLSPSLVAVRAEGVVALIVGGR